MGKATSDLDLMVSMQVGKKALTLTDPIYPSEYGPLKMTNQLFLNKDPPWVLLHLL